MSNVVKNAIFWIVWSGFRPENARKLGFSRSHVIALTNLDDATDFFWPHRFARHFCPNALIDWIFWLSIDLGRALIILKGLCLTRLTFFATALQSWEGKIYATARRPLATDFDPTARPLHWTDWFCRCGIRKINSQTLSREFQNFSVLGFGDAHLEYLARFFLA